VYPNMTGQNIRPKPLHRWALAGHPRRSAGLAAPRRSPLVAKARAFKETP
jgi:hypothetical protein